MINFFFKSVAHGNFVAKPLNDHNPTPVHCKQDISHVKFA